MWPFKKKSAPKNVYRIRFMKCFNIDNSNSNDIKTTIEFNDCDEMFIAAASQAEAVMILFARQDPISGMIFIQTVECIQPIIC